MSSPTTTKYLDLVIAHHSQIQYGEHSLEHSMEESTAEGQSATFKSIRSLQPLLDRVLVQRFKAETASHHCVHHDHLPGLMPLIRGISVIVRVHRSILTARKPQPAFSSHHQQLKALCPKQQSSPSVQVHQTRTDRSSRSQCRLETGYCFQDGVVVRSKSARR